jgi:uncharacterized cupin superfamily protein
MPAPYPGHCQCGDIQFELRAEPHTLYACHCTDCQRRSGGAMRLSMWVDRAALHLLAGEPQTRSFLKASGRTRVARICERCDCELWTEPPDHPTLAVLRPGCLLAHKQFEPVAHLFVRSALPWLRLPEHARQYETMPDDPLEMVRLWRQQHPVSAAAAEPGSPAGTAADRKPAALAALDLPLPAKSTNYPEPYASLVRGREKRRLGDVFGLTNFGVNLTRLKPGAVSSVRHWHTRQDEFVYILEGRPTLVTDAGAQPLRPGQCAGFPAGAENGHQLRNDSQADAWYLEVGDRTAGDKAHYPDDDLAVTRPDGVYVFTRKNGAPIDGTS